MTIVDRGERLATAMDGEISSRIEELFRAWGVDVKFGCTVEDVAAKGEALDVTLSTQERVAADTVDANFRTSADGIYAAGDVLKPSLASIAMEQGRAAVCSAFGFSFEGNVDPTPVSAIYGMPELSGAGLTEEACRERGLSYEVGRSDLALTPRGAIAGRGGLLKLIFQREDRKLVGVHCIGDIASEIVGIGQMAIRCGGTLNTLAAPTPILLSPLGVPAIAVDGTTQKVFVLGVDSNTEGLVLTVDGPSGVPVDIENTASHVSASASGVVSLGDGTAAILLLSPGVVKRLGDHDLSLPDGFTPTGVAGVDVGSGASALVVGFGAERPLRGYIVDPASRVLSPFSLPAEGDLAAGTIVEEVVPAAATASVSELYLDLAPDATGTLPSGPAETIKVALTVVK